MSDCRKYQLYLMSLADGDVSTTPEEVVREVHLHLRDCPACQMELAAQKEAIRLLEANP